MKGTNNFFLNNRQFSLGNRIGEGASSTVYQVSALVNEIPFVSSSPYSFDFKQTEKTPANNEMLTQFQSNKSSTGYQLAEALKVFSKKISQDKPVKNMTAKYIKEIQTELTVLSLISHPGIIQMHDFGFNCPLLSPQDSFLLTELCPNGSVYDFFEFVQTNRKLKPFRRKIYIHMIAQVISALEHLNKVGVDHRDIKAENIGLDHLYRVKLLDFGVAYIQPESILKSLELPERVLEMCAYLQNFNFNPEEEPQSPRLQPKPYIGSIHYISPEMIDLARQSSFDYRLYVKTDIWSLGVFLFISFADQFPFEGNNFETLQRIRECQPNFDAIKDEAIRELVKRMLVKDTSQRATIQEIKQHTLFANIDFNRISITESPVVSLLKKDSPSLKVYFKDELLISKENYFTARKVVVVVKMPKTAESTQSIVEQNQHKSLCATQTGSEVSLCSISFNSMKSHNGNGLPQAYVYIMKEQIDINSQVQKNSGASSRQSIPLRASTCVQIKGEYCVIEVRSSLDDLYEYIIGGSKKKLQAFVEACENAKAQSMQ